MIFICLNVRASILFFSNLEMMPCLKFPTKVKILVNVGKFHLQPHNVQQTSQECNRFVLPFAYGECTSEEPTTSFGIFYFLVAF